MICPACGARHFAPAKIEGGLPAERCAECQGVWVELERYRLWRRQMPQLALELEGDITPSNSSVRVCPVTGRLMTRIRVSNAHPLLLDYSAAAQAVWFDRGEWERLVALGLHDQLDAVVSEKWQAGLRLEASRERTNAAMRLRFGDEAFARLTDMRTWLEQQPNRAEMLAFLQTKAD
ncbi:zf-TFIIB domain-containing protein [Massilia sp. PAMC28688]|uniref:TFIIB-type zinc ribbon-containing protein n=1 Tax=Massilia sp. PAMC28688 TaxID=2861283 RepID=UPI001C6358D0|nr:zf-TFIIB domain-containing protein [Massilia sp. PAMC28688]QYF95296.1 zf-TFIIB domain-containing protein [Massilia sp. PAMC28688]